MLVLTLRTDNPQAEVGLYDGQTELVYHKWEAHRQLAETLHTTIAELLHEHHKDWSDIGGVVVYEGPGSFTGLRIGVSVANALAYGLGIPVVGASGEDWCTTGLADVQNGKGTTLVVPHYGAPVHITTPKR
jgi:tRNA threonylcarbamoyladenosine biosynthesis protein TsaB